MGGDRAGRGGSPGRGALPEPERRRFPVPADFKEDEEAGFMGLPFIQPEGDDEWVDNVPWEAVCVWSHAGRRGVNTGSLGLTSK